MATLIVDAAGHPELSSIHVVRASDSLLVPTTVAIVMHTRYCPGGHEGHPVRTRTVMRIRYRFEIHPEERLPEIVEEVSP